MGWDAGLNRRLAVPLAVNKYSRSGAIRTRILKNDDVLDDLEVVTKLAETRARIDKLCEDLNVDPASTKEGPQLTAELDFLETSIKLDMLQIVAELEQSPDADEIFEEEAESAPEFASA